MVKELIPKPKSVFVRLKCSHCGNEQIIFERSSSNVKCTVCEEILVEPSGGKAKIKGEKIQILY